MPPIVQPEHALAFLHQRRTPKFFIANASGAAMYCASELTGSPLLARSRHVLEAVLERDVEVRDLTFEQLDAEVMLRGISRAGKEPQLGRGGSQAVRREPSRVGRARAAGCRLDDRGDRRAALH